MIGGCGALPHAPAGEGRFRALENGEQSVQAQRAKPSTATENSEIVVQRESQTSKHPSFQTSTFPCTPGTSDGRANKHAGAGRACAQGTRPARGPVGAWRASHAMLWGVWKSSGGVAVLVVLYVLWVLPRSLVMFREDLKEGPSAKTMGGRERSAGV